MIFVSSASSVVKSRGYFGEAAETFSGAEAACAPQIRGIRVIRLPRRSVCGEGGVVFCFIFVRVVFVSIRGSWFSKILRNFP